MSYTQVFGGGTINPARRTYLSLVTAVDVQLQWPIEQQITGENVAADIIDVEATVPGLNVDFDDAQIVSTGFTSLVTNVGAQTVTVRDSAGGTIISLTPGEAWFIYLTDNSTAAGTWRTFQLGATVSVASASALAGAGLKAIATTLNQRIAPTLTGVTPITWVDGDRAQFTVWNGGVGVLNLPVPGTVGSDWWSVARNEGSGTFTLTPPAGTIDSQATLIMNPGDSAIVVTDGVNFYTIGLGGSTTVGFDFVQIDVSGSGDFILSGVQLNRIAYEFIGALTGNRKIIVPNTLQQYWVANFTTGAFTFEVATAAQVTPIQVVQNNRSILYCDGTDVVDAETGTLTPPISIGQGGTGAVTAAAALANLGGVSTTRLINTAAGSGLAGGGDLSADRSLVQDVDDLVTELTVDPIADTMPFYDDSAVGTRKTPIISLAGNDLKRKNSDTLKTSDIVLAADPDLSGWVIPASGIYLISGILAFNALAGPNVQLRFATTATDTDVTQSYLLYLGNSSGGVYFNDTTTDAIATLISSIGMTPTRVTGIIRFTGATVLDLDWAQNSSSANTLTLKEGSYINLVRVGQPQSLTAAQFIS